MLRPPPRRPDSQYGPAPQPLSDALTCDLPLRPHRRAERYHLSWLAKERIRRATMAALALDVGLDPRDLRPQFADVISQFLDPQRIEHQLLQPGSLANRQFLFFQCHD